MLTESNTTIISLTEPGKRLAEKLLKQQIAIEGRYQHCHRPKPFSTIVKGLFRSGHRLLFICSTGIVFRTLAPEIKDKHQDPAILVLDQQGKHVIPLLSGHEGGANEWARQLAQFIGATAVITSAETYTNPIYTLGIGCDRGCPIEEIEALVMQSFEALRSKHPHLSMSSIGSISSIDLKADEVGLLAFCSKASLELSVFPATTLRTVEEQLSYKSDIVFREVGCYGVAEAAALLSASAATGNSSELILTKQKSKRATCAIARSYSASEQIDNR